MASAAAQQGYPTSGEHRPAQAPFDGAANGTVQATPEGEVWVLRLRKAGDKIPT